MSSPKPTNQKKLGIRPATQAKYADTAKKTRRKMVDVADLAIDFYRDSIGLTKRKSNSVAATAGAT